MEESVNSLMHELDDLQKAWESEGLICQDRYGADYTIRTIELAQRILVAALWYRSLLAEDVK